MSAKKVATKKATGIPRRSPKAAAWFDGVVGQESAKKELGFYLRNHLDNDAPLPNILLEGSQGDGKTHLAKKYARNFPDPSDPSRKNKKFLPVDGSAVKNLTVLFVDVCSKFANGDDYATIFVDEAHGLPKVVQNAFLTITEPNRAGITRYTFDDVDYIFDARKITWIFATTEADRIFKPLRDRLHSIQLQPYGPEELQEIMLLTLDGKVTFKDGMLEELSQLVRRNARHADRLANNVLALGAATFTKTHLNYLVGELGLLPHGISKDELRVLEILAEEGEMSLGHLASRLGKPPKAVQLELEPYPIALGYMEIDGKRRISGKGRVFLKELSSTRKK